MTDIQVKKSDQNLSDLQNQVLIFWFGDPPDYETPREMWFRVDPDLDSEIIKRFFAVHEQIRAGEWNQLLETPLGTLTFLVVLDQFSRNMYRGTAAAFAADPQARDAASQAIAKGFDQQLTPLQRTFLYLPFEHSEDLADQERSCALFAALGLAEPLKYAEQHRVIIARFGRFPHRNQILKRQSTPEEVLFLQQPGSSF